MNNLIADNKFFNKDISINTRNQWLLGVLIILLLILYLPTLLWLWGRWTMSVWQNGHGILVFALVMYLMGRELHKLKDLPSSANGWGFIILIPSLLLYMLDTGINTQLLSSLAMISSFVGLSLLFLGGVKTKTILFILSRILPSKYQKYQKGDSLEKVFWGCCSRMSPAPITEDAHRGRISPNMILLRLLILTDYLPSKYQQV